MKANELRIGNLLQSDTNTIIKIVGVVKKDIYYYHNKKNLYVLELNNLNFQPLELTEEWLLKFGFEILLTDNDSVLYRLNSQDVNIHPIGGFTYGVRGVPLVKIKYINQLQNLYFALTNEELTMK
jgi:hypothetical protein